MTECWITLTGDRKCQCFLVRQWSMKCLGQRARREITADSFPQIICAPSTEYTDWGTKLKYQFVLHWIISSSFAPLPLRMNPLLNRASILCSDAVVNWDSVSSLSQATAVPRCISWFINPCLTLFKETNLDWWDFFFFLWISVSDKLLRSNVKVPASSSG